jgi:hypothetical protein
MVAEAFDRGEARAYQLGEIVGRDSGRLVWDSVALYASHSHSGVG